MGTLGTQELPSRAHWRGRTAGRCIARCGVLGAVLAVAPLVTGCSSFSSPLPSSAATSNQAMAVPPPPSAAAPASASAAPAYPPPQAQPQQANAGATNNFVSMFRDPPSQQEYDARASVYPQQSLTDLFKGSTDQSATPDPRGGTGYPLQPLISSQPAGQPVQQANMPHPPSSYTPSQQPYVPPQPTPAGYTPQPGGAPPPAAAPQQPPPQPPAANAGAYPQQSLSDLFKGSGQ